MNLIEQLGGYVKAKKYHEDRVKSHKTFIADNLEKQLLEYRRQHNIYEVGDSFVFNGGDNPEIMKVQHVWDDAVWGGYCGEIPKITDIRHATPEEIQAGKRL